MMMKKYGFFVAAIEEMLLKLGPAPSPSPPPMPPTTTKTTRAATVTPKHTPYSWWFCYHNSWLPPFSPKYKRSTATKKSTPNIFKPFITFNWRACCFPLFLRAFPPFACVCWCVFAYRCWCILFWMPYSHIFHRTATSIISILFIFIKQPHSCILCTSHPYPRIRTGVFKCVRVYNKSSLVHTHHDNGVSVCACVGAHASNGKINDLSACVGGGRCCGRHDHGECFGLASARD